jgi:hypothetical protein
MQPKKRLPLAAGAMPWPAGSLQLTTHEREESMAKVKRTTHRSVTGKKLYAVRDAQGRFKEIQTYERAHGQDVKRKSRKESKG